MPHPLLQGCVLPSTAAWLVLHESWGSPNPATWCIVSAGDPVVEVGHVKEDRDHCFPHGIVVLREECSLQGNLQAFSARDCPFPMVFSQDGGLPTLGDGLAKTTPKPIHSCYQCYWSFNLDLGKRAMRDVAHCCGKTACASISWKIWTRSCIAWYGRALRKSKLIPSRPGALRLRCLIVA